jgi:glyoxylase-like metal-dependent hydrolase (beta-lactamase superfamily II)
MSRFTSKLATAVTATLVTLPAWAVDVVFSPVAEGVYAYIGLLVTPAGAVLIDSGASFQSAQKVHEAARKVTTQPVKWVINSGAQIHRWLGNGYFHAQGITTIAHADAQADMSVRAGEHLAGLQVLKERLEGTVPALPTR